MRRTVLILALSFFLTPPFVHSAVVSQPSLGVTVKVNTSEKTAQSASLFGYWTMDPSDVNTSTIYDRSRKGFTGTASGFGSALVKTPGKLGEALVFDGDDDTFSMGDVAEPGTITLAAWVKPRAVTGGMKIISKKMSGASSQYGLGTHSSNTDKFTSVFFSSAPSSDVCTSTGAEGTYAAHTWYFVAATYDGDTCKIYVDGVDVTSVTSDTASGNILNTTSALRIGAEGGATPSGYWRGALDDVRIYNRAFTAAEITALYNSSGRSFTVNASKNDRVTNGLVGLWSFDGPDMFINVKDRSGQGNDGNMIGFGATSTAVTPGKIGQGLKFDGVNDHFTVAQQDRFDFHTSPFSISVWVLDDSSSATLNTLGHRIVSWYTGTTNIQLAVNASAPVGSRVISLINSATTATPQITSSGELSLGWNHVVTTFDGSSTYHIYINGANRDGGTGATLVVFTSNSTTLYAGQRGNGGFLSGKMDDLRIYNRVLSTSEITQLYNLGR